MSTITPYVNSDSGSSVLSKLNTNEANLNTDKQEKGSGVTGNIPTFGASNVLGDSGKVPPSGVIVGNTDTQTLTNKTLTAPTVTNPSTTGTDAGVETLQNKTISGASNTLTVREADLSITDVTTGNVSITAHGFTPKAPNDTSKYLRGDGAWGPAPGSIISKTGTSSFASATGTQTIAHGLGKTPFVLRVYAAGQNAGVGYSSSGVYDGTNNRCTFFRFSNGVAPAVGTSNNVIDLEDGSSNNYTATATVDGTNITISWTKTGTATTAYFTWEVMG